MSSRITIILALCLIALPSFAIEPPSKESIEKEIVAVEKPLYSAFVERYVLDELRQLRTDMAQQRAEFIQQLADRELNTADRVMTYATDTVTYFFYLIASASSILVLIGWSSMREIKERVHSLADEEITKLVDEYEQRLNKIEQQMRDRTHDIEENREEIGLTQDIQSLWLKAGRENDVHGKIAIYDQILQLRSDDVEALTFKADAVLQLDEAQWAINLCHQALNIDPDNSHAFYQLACAHTAIDQFEDAVRYLSEVLERTDVFREKIINDPDLDALHGLDAYEKLLYPKA